MREKMSLWNLNSMVARTPIQCDISWNTYVDRWHSTWFHLYLKYLQAIKDCWKRKDHFLLGRSALVYDPCFWHLWILEFDFLIVVLRFWTLEWNLFIFSPFSDLWRYFYPFCILSSTPGTLFFCFFALLLRLFSLWFAIVSLISHF